MPTESRPCWSGIHMSEGKGKIEYEIGSIIWWSACHTLIGSVMSRQEPARVFFCKTTAGIIQSSSGAKARRSGAESRRSGAEKRRSFCCFVLCIMWAVAVPVCRVFTTTVHCTHEFCISSTLLDRTHLACPCFRLLTITSH